MPAALQATAAPVRAALQAHGAGQTRAAPSVAQPSARGGGFGGGPPAGGVQFSGHVFHGYDGSEQRDGSGNFGDRRGFGNEFTSARRFHLGAYRQPAGWYAHQWRHGEILPALFWTQDYWLLNYWLYGLTPPPYG